MLVMFNLFLTFLILFLFSAWRFSTYGLFYTTLRSFSNFFVSNHKLLSTLSKSIQSNQIIWYRRSIGGISELLGDLDDFHNGFKSVASLDLPLLLLGNLTDAWPAVLLHGQSPLHAVEIGSLVFSLFLGGLVAVLEGLMK